jgi:exopolyphosphatase/guanosine-5'-triphosphate,3'-diphosphate pyrophosphatase
MEKYAIIDLGSNSARLHIYHIKEDGSYYLLESVKEKVRLSEGMAGGNLIQKEPLRRTIETLKLFTSLISAHSIGALYPLATAAIRSSVNQRAVLEEIKSATGLDFQVLSGEEEAYFDYVGVINSIDEKDFVLLDIGGGSAEVVWVQNRQPLKAISIPYGSVNLTETFIKPFGYEQGMKKMEKALKHIFAEIPWLTEVIGLPIVGLGGAIRTFAKVDRNLNDYPIYTVHNYQMDVDEVKKVFQLILSFDPKEIDQLPGVGKKRSDVLQGGLVPLKLLFNQLNSQKLIISEQGLREGYFYKCLAAYRGQTEVVFADVLEESLDNHTKRFKINKSHAATVFDTVTLLFDALKKAHRFNEEDLKILRIASLLHDVGLTIDYDMHHRHGFYIMMHMHLYGLSNKELTAAAYLIGRHRSADNKLHLVEYDIMMRDFEIETYDKYIGLLQIAEQLDRSESGRLRVCSAEKKGQKLMITYKAEESVAIEILYAAQVEPIFQKHFGLSLVFEQK